MKPGWAIIGKNKARRPFERYEEIPWGYKKGRVKIWLGGKSVIIDEKDVITWPESDEDAPQSMNLNRGDSDG